MIDMRKFEKMRTIFTILVLAVGTNAFAQSPSAEQVWVDSMYASMSLEERLGQLFVIRAHSNLGDEHIAKVESQIQKYKVGGLCFFQGTPEKQAELTNRYQKMSKVPLMVTMDAEWGLSMRLKETCITYPRQLMLGAIQDNRLIYDFGKTMAKECRRLGVHVNFAPVADINNNPNNPVINDRSFGENKYNVAVKTLLLMQGMQDNNVLASAKHFPGHGDTDVDSHFDLPIITHEINRLKNVELMPFRALAQYGIGSMMVAHLQVPAIDNTDNLPTSLSGLAVRQLLREQMGYDGLVFTDGLEMKGVTKNFQNGEVSAMALAAGCDMLLLPEDLEAALNTIKKYIEEYKIDLVQIEKSVKRVLKAKYRLGLTTPQYVPLENLRSDLNSYEGKLMKRELIKAALTLVRDEHKILPFQNYQPDNIAAVTIGAKSWTPFQAMLSNYGIYNQVSLEKNMGESKKTEMLAFLAKKGTVIVALDGMDRQSKTDFGITEQTRAFVEELAAQTKVILVVFGNPYALKFFDKQKTVLECYNGDDETQEIAAESLFGVFPFKGKLPITASDKSKYAMGISSNTVIKRLEWNTQLPEAVGMSYEKLQHIDTLAKQLIAEGAAPSCQILVARNGQVVYHKAFGTYSYDANYPANLETLYDLASVTKVVSTTMSLMKLYDDKKIKLDQKMSDFLPILKGSNKESVVFKDVLVHQAGLPPWIAFYKNTIDSIGQKRPSPFYYATTETDKFTIPVAKNLYLRSDYRDSIMQQIADAKMRPNRDYVYSDLGMILMTDLIKNVTGKSLDVFATETFYTPLSMSRTLYNPTYRFAEERCAPTDEDRYFRMQRIQGSVHDMGAAMLGGVSGHAGLFSVSSDLAHLFQMLLNKGEYAGTRYLSPETVQLFTSRQEGSTRRGYGWDMKETAQNKTMNMSLLASYNTYGHTGFTGNCVYADPDKNLIYIFLSNRTFPDMNNNKLVNTGWRTIIQNAIYEAIK